MGYRIGHEGYLIDNDGRRVGYIDYNGVERFTPELQRNADGIVTGLMAGGQEILPIVSVKAFGAVGDGATDCTSALTAAFAVGLPVYVPHGTFIVDSVTAANVFLFGPGTLKKKPATKGRLLNLTGDNRIEGVTFDYDWEGTLDTLPYYENVSLYQTGGSLTVRGVHFRRSHAAAIQCFGSSLHLTTSTFKEGAPHNNLDGGNERPGIYVAVVAKTDIMTGSEQVLIQGNYFEGPDKTNYHLNPCGVLLRPESLDSVRYKSVNISGNTFLACGQNAGSKSAGNITGAIDTYNGVEHLVISGNTIRDFSYAGIKVHNSSDLTIVGNSVIGGHTSADASTTTTAIGIIVYEKVRGSTAEQSNAVISSNVIKGCSYMGISCNVDRAVISENVIDGVTFMTNFGVGIYSHGANVNIVNNILRDIQGSMIDIAGSGVSKVRIAGNQGYARADATAGFVVFQGSDISILDNLFHNDTGTSASALRTNGPASKLRFSGNALKGAAFGVDLRTTSGAVSDVEIGPNTFDTVTTRVNISGATGVRTIQPRSVSADKGDANATFTPWSSETVQLFATELTANRTLGLSTTGATNGMVCEVLRTAGGSFDLSVGTGPLKVMPANSRAVFVFNGSAWALASYQTL